MKRTRLSIFVSVPLVLAACRSQTGTVLELQETPAFEDDCTLSAVPTKYQVTGFYDPSGGGAYIMPIQMINPTNDTENPAAIPGDTNIKPSANDAQVIGFDYCFYHAVGDVTGYDPKGKGLLVDCDDLPDSQRGFLPASGSVQAGGGTLVGAVNPLNITALQNIFGENFNPTLIPVRDNATNTATRSGSWGNFPDDFSTLVIVNLRLRAANQAGGTMRSNWYAFPVLIAPTAVRDACGASVLPCPGGGTARQGSEFPPDICGEVFSGANFACVAVDECP